MNVSDRKEMTVTAAVDGMAAARSMVAALQAAGIESGRISIGTADGVREAPRLPGNEAPLLWRVFALGFLWGVAGALLGAIVGLVLGVYGIGVPGTPDNIGIQIASWAMFMHVTGALVGCYLALDTGDRFAATVEHHDRERVQVRVRAQHRAELDRAIEVLRGGERRDVGSGM